MESVLNEISIENLATTPHAAQKQMEELIKFCGKLNEFGFTKLRLPDEHFFQKPLALDYTLNDWLNDSNVNGILKTLFLGLKAYPYFEELNADSEDNYISSAFFLDEPAHPHHAMKVLGLADAYLRNTLCVSFCSHPIWKKCKIGLSIKSEPIGEENGTKSVEVIHSCCWNECLGEKFKEWLKKRNRPPLNSHADIDIWFPPDKYQLFDAAKDDLIFLYQNNRHKIIEEIEGMISEIWQNPMVGTGKPESLKDDFAGWMSRRITKKDRLVYKLENDILSLYQCRGHYDDK